MPTGFFGRLEVLARNDLGSLAAAEGRPVEVEVPLALALAPLAPYACLAVLLLARPNRSLRAWLVLVPLAIAWGCRLILDWMPGLARGQIPSPIGSSAWAAAMGVTLALLLLPWMGRLRRARALGCTLAVMAALTAVQAAEAGDPRGALLPGLTCLVVLVGGVLAVASCRSRYRPLRALVVLLLACAGSALLIGLGEALAVARFGGDGIGRLPLAVRELGRILNGGLGGIGLAVLLVPFALLVHFDGLYRDRFAHVLGLPDGAGTGVGTPR